MIVDVERHAFAAGGRIRRVELPDRLDDPDPARVLPWVWYYGQNDHQPQPCRSVSMGDIIRLGGRRWIIRAAGFEPVADDYQPTEADWLVGSWSGCPGPAPEAGSDDAFPLRPPAHALVALVAAQAAAIAERWARAYPTAVFPDPPPGQHGRTVDACSARAARHVAKGIAAEIRALTADETLLARIADTLAEDAGAPDKP